jgi:hypothetical protein
MFHSLPGPRNRMKEIGGSWTSWLARGLWQLTQSKKAGNELPPVGQRCLVLQGIEGHDLGQPAIISMQTRARVHVAYLDSKGRQVSQVKVPSSLMLLEDGLEIVRDEDGFIWIRRSRIVASNLLLRNPILSKPWSVLDP